MALNILVSQRNGSDSMFESHYLKPFIVSLGITTILVSGMGLSLRGMAGTGAAHDAAEISFDLPDDGESSAEVTGTNATTGGEGSTCRGCARTYRTKV